MNVNEQLIESAGNCDLEGVKSAVEAGADVNYLDEILGESAITTVIDYFPYDGVTADEYDPLFKEQLAELKQQNEGKAIRVIEYLLDHGADVNLCARGTQTPLEASLNSASPAIARFLLEHGADPNVNSYDGLDGYEEESKYSSFVMGSIRENCTVYVGNSPEEEEIWDLCKQFGGKLYKDDMIPENVKNDPELMEYYQGK